jgi:3-oxoacyl-[acyl-carrier protein] reductase
MKAALVTGAGKGIGKCISYKLADLGYRLALCSRDPLDLNMMESELSGKTDVLTSAFDVRDYERFSAFIQEIERKYSKIDLLVVNAGISPENETVEKSDIGKWIDTIETNLIGSYVSVKASMPLVKKSHEGKIILIGSGLGHKGYPGTSAYSSSKAGVFMLMKVLSQELITENICVNELIPGPVKTGIDRNRENNDASQRFDHEWHKNADDVMPIFEFLINQPANGPTGQTFSLMRREL